MDTEPEWSDATVIIELLLDVQAGVYRLLNYFEGNDDEEEVPEEDA